MEQTEPEIGEILGGKPRVLGHCRPCLDRFGFLDERADDEGLPPLGDLLADEGVGACPLVRLQPLRLHRQTARRELVDNGKIEGSIEGERERSRYRRGRHDGQVRIEPLLAERLPLLHSEAVLLVNDRQPQPVKGHLLLDKGMGADDEVYLSAEDAFLYSPASGPGERPDEHGRGKRASEDTRIAAE